MSDLQSVLKPYTCHKKVKASEITSVGEYGMITLERAVTLACPDEMFSRYRPVPGDFLVVYEDGYKAFSPRQAFLDGYKADGESFADIKEGLKIKNRTASTNVDDGVALSCAPHPSDEERN